MTVISRFVQAVSHGGAMRPTLQVVHDAETPLKAGYAASIAENWFGKVAPTSAHFMVDPVEIVRMLSDNVVAWAVGPAANGFTLNWEQAGYASLTRAQWTTAAGLAQMDLLAQGLVERGRANGIPRRWASDDDIRAAAHGVPAGICYHDDIRRVLGGTTHHDPTPNYPRDLLMARVAAYDSSSAQPARPAPPQEDDMPLLVQVKVEDGYVPHLLDGPRYQQIKTSGFVKSLKAAGVKEVVVDQTEHANLAAYGRPAGA